MLLHKRISNLVSILATDVYSVSIQDKSSHTPGIAELKAMPWSLRAPKYVSLLWLQDKESLSTSLNDCTGKDLEEKTETHEVNGVKTSDM